MNPEENQSQQEIQKSPKKSSRPEWVNKALSLREFHRKKLQENEGNWTLGKTAEALKVSIGAVSEDLLLASWLRTHEEELLKREFRRDALEFVRKKRRALAYGED